MRIFADNQPVRRLSTGEWGRVTGFTHWARDPKAPVYRFETPDGLERWIEEKDLVASNVMEALNTPYFWAVGAVALVIFLAACGIL